MNNNMQVPFPHSGAQLWVVAVARGGAAPCTTTVVGTLPQWSVGSGMTLFVDGPIFSTLFTPLLFTCSVWLLDLDTYIFSFGLIKRTPCF